MIPDLANIVYDYYDNSKIIELSTKQQISLLLDEFDLRVMRLHDGAIHLKTLYVNKISGRRILHIKLFGRDYSWVSVAKSSLKGFVVFDYVSHVQQTIREIID
jgi:hypothetical protein